ncbi:hypothetical protein [Sansalvadorimonas verongulae]|uniref:hypothetical protein n=1 Tax=Sansalvadorimonas verongulae TaxID=2172824 RepID=UPI0012BB4D34|nr:hypothetical protein [Sansalvadorimonas verongulae]MTI15210.1 hypothetical protein [Sansalvadorimonas verongulae]
MSEKNKQYCCRFEKKDGWFTPVWISGFGLTLSEAKAWAKKECQKNPDYLQVNDVYEVEE